MKKLLKGIKARFEGSATLSAVYGTLALTQHEDEVTFPYAVVGWTSNTPMHAFGGYTNRIDDCEVTIHLWHTSADTLASHADTLDGLFDHAAFDLDSPEQVVGCLLVSRYGPTYEGNTSSNQPVYRLLSTYRFLVDLT